MRNAVASWIGGLAVAIAILTDAIITEAMGRAEMVACSLGNDRLVPVRC